MEYKVTKNECYELMNCKCCHRNEDGTYTCIGCGSVVASKRVDVETDANALEYAT